MGLAVAAWLIGSDFPLVGDLDAEGDPTWGVVSYVLLATAAVARVFGWCRHFWSMPNPAAFARMAQKRDHG